MVVLMWVGAGVYYLRGRPEGRPTDSIGHFRKQLRVLERTGPALIDPAHRLSRWRPDPMVAASVVRPMRQPSFVASRRRRAIKRRRDIFFGLVLAVVGSLLLGLVPGLRVMWILAAVLTFALAGYVVVLIQLRNQAAERTMRIRFRRDTDLRLMRNADMRFIREPEPAPVLLRRSAN
jgi:hypothetical protein